MKKLLIVVDYQKDFVDGSLGFDDAKKLDDYISYLIDSYHKNNDDVLFAFDTHHDNYLKTQEGQHLPVVHCLENSEGWKLYGHVSEKIKPVNPPARSKVNASVIKSRIIPEGFIPRALKVPLSTLRLITITLYVLEIPTEIIIASSTIIAITISCKA